MYERPEKRHSGWDRNCFRVCVSDEIPIFCIYSAWMNGLEIRLEDGIRNTPNKKIRLFVILVISYI